ncbi:MAG TPA: GWxTD domain-containing protein [Thermoanaerobaculia bacterium]
MRVKLLVVTAVLMIAGVAEAGVSKAAQEWRKGPEKFLMTDEEERAWKSVQTDEAAAAFIDLFWVRRDPTAGTPRNEFREEFQRRVQYADLSFEEKRKRGALTDRGQVYILLGPPENGSRDSMTVQGPSGMSAASARTGDNVVWSWPREVAIALGVPKINVTFNQIIGSNVYSRDTKYGQFSNVSATQIKKNIVNPELTTAPAWALKVGNEVLGGVASPPVAPTNAKATGRIGRLVLISDLGALDLDAADPVAALQPVTEFAAEGELGFLLEYCGGQGNLRVEVKADHLAAASEMEPAPMKGVAGCAAVPGMLPLSGLKPGSYDLEITTIEANGGRLSTKKRIHIK